MLVRSLLLLGTMVTVTASCSDGGVSSTRAAEVPRSSLDQRTERGTQSTSSDIVRGGGRGGEHHHMKHKN